MKILIMTDLEGISGIDAIEQVQDTESALYEQVLEHLMQDVNAAVDAAIDTGVEQVYVVDGHGSGHNFLPGLLDPRARQLGHPDWQDVITRRQVSAYLEIGAHAMAGTVDAFIDHTQNSTRWSDYRINGRSSGEIAQGAAFAGAYDIPFIMVSGDAAACAEAVTLLGPVATAVVKQGITRDQARLVVVDIALQRIRDAVQTGIRRMRDIRPWQPKLPLDLQLTLTRIEYCDEMLARCPELLRINKLTVCKQVGRIRHYEDLLF